MACPEGQYFCNDRGKCMPIPKGHKVRKDGELVKEVHLLDGDIPRQRKKRLTLVNPSLRLEVVLLPLIVLVKRVDLKDLKRICLN